MLFGDRENSAFKIDEIWDVLELDLHRVGVEPRSKGIEVGEPALRNAVERGLHLRVGFGRYVALNVTRNPGGREDQGGVCGSPVVLKLVCV